MNDTTRRRSAEREVTLVFDLADAEALVEMLDDVCCRMRHKGKPADSRVELRLALPRRVVEEAAAEE